MMKKYKILALLCVFVICTLMSGNILIYAEDKIPELEVSVINFAYGNMYFEDEMPSFRIKITNPSSNSYETQMQYCVTDGDGNVVWSDTKTLSVEADSVLACGVYPDMNSYGIFDFTAEMTGDFGCVEAEKTYSVVAKSEDADRYIGTQTHFAHPSVYENIYAINQLKQSGYGWVRDDIFWNLYEQEEGVYSDDNIKSALQAYDELIENGTDILLNLHVINPVYYADGLIPDYGTDEFAKYVAAYGDFCSDVATRLLGKINAYEIGNEFDNLTDGDGNRYTTPQQYAALLKEAYDSIKNVDESIIVVGGVLCSYLNDENRTFLAELATEINANGTVFDYMDVFSFHPYNNTGLYSDEEPEYTFLQNVGYVREQLGDEIPVWISEYGTPSCEVGDDHSWSYTEKMQAENLVRTVVAARSDEQIERLSFYNYHEKGRDSISKEDNYGIVDSDYNAKPAAVSLAFANRVLNGTEYVSKLANDDYYSGLELWYKQNRSFDAYRFKRNSEDIFVLWAHTDKSSTLNIVRAEATETAISEADGNVTISTADDNVVEIRDIYGNLVDGYSVALSERPVYVICRPQIEIIRDGSDTIIRGTADKVFSMITLKALRRGVLNEEIVEIGQTRSNGNRSFEFVLNIPEEEAYVLYISENDNIQCVSQGTVDYDIELECLVNGTKLKSLDDVKNGDTINVKMDITDYTAGEEKLLFIGLLGGKDGALRKVQVKELEPCGGTVTESIEFAVEDAGDIEAFKLMLWDENRRPVSKPLVIIH